MATRLLHLRSRNMFLAILSIALATPVAGDVTLEVSQPDYQLGEVVSFTLTNGSKYIITLPHAIGWWQIHDAKENLVGGCQVQPTEIELYPGYSFSDTWDQTLCREGPQVPQGRYRLGVDYQSECCPGYLSVETWFDIGLAPVEPTSWGRIKATYR